LDNLDKPASKCCFEAVEMLAQHSAPLFDVVIVGASFAGMELYYQLRLRREGRALSLCLIDRQASHGYIPLVHERLIDRQRDGEAHSQLPTARLIARDPNARFVQAEVSAISASERAVTLHDGTVIRGRKLVIALGSQLAPPPSLPGAEHLVRYKFDAELASARARLSQLQKGQAHIVVVGGGVSGVELAGELAHAQLGHVTLLQAADRLLTQLQPRAAASALAKLRQQGVQVHTGARLTRVEPRSLQLQGSIERLASDLTFWAAGVRPNPLVQTLGLACTDRGYLAVSPQLQCRTTSGSALPDVFACGDAVRIVDGSGEWPTMQRAIECIWQGKLVAKNLLSEQLRSHKLTRDFPYGVSLGAASLIVYGRLALSLGGFAVWFRRFLRWGYIHRYAWLFIAPRRSHQLPELQPPAAASEQLRP
jgi:NADH:ubiquinone reductase (H+-translocating)